MALTAEAPGDGVWWERVAAAEILGDVGGAFVLGGSWCDGTFLGQSLGLRGPGLGLWLLTCVTSGERLSLA